MQKRTCPNGHVYDQSIYGDRCPLCPPQQAATSSDQFNAGMGRQSDYSAADPGAKTKVVAPQGAPAYGQQQIAPVNGPQQMDPTGKTFNSALNQQQQQPQTQQSPRTVIRHAGVQPGAAKLPDNARKLVGFLVTYNKNPMGKAYNLYEGRNLIGRAPDCDVSIPDDTQMSGQHMTIRFLSGNGKFRFKDEMSSNGTYINKELLDEGELQNYDIIRLGSTLFIFIAIPQI